MKNQLLVQLEEMITGLETENAELRRQLEEAKQQTVSVTPSLPIHQIRLTGATQDIMELVEMFARPSKVQDVRIFASEVMKVLEKNQAISRESEEANEQWHADLLAGRGGMLALFEDKEVEEVVAPATELVEPPVDAEMKHDSLDDMFGAFEEVAEEQPVQDDMFAGLDQVEPPQETEQAEESDMFAGFGAVEETPVQEEVKATENVFDSIIESPVEVGGVEITPQDVAILPDASYVTKNVEKPKTLKKGEISINTYNVNGTAIHYGQKSARIMSHGDRNVRTQALKLNDYMRAGSSTRKAKNKAEERKQHEGRFVTRIVREFALETALANGVDFIAGDGGAALLVAEVTQGIAKAPVMRSRTKDEYYSTLKAMENMKTDSAYAQQIRNLVDSWSYLFGFKNCVIEAGELSGADYELYAYALVGTRLSQTWDATNQPRRYESVYEVVLESVRTEQQMIQAGYSFV